jgi:hypothetical protein
MCSKPKVKVQKVQAKAGAAPVKAAAPAVAPQNADVAAGARGRSGRMAGRRSQRRNARDGLKMALDVSVANVGGSGRTGLNIPQPKG